MSNKTETDALIRQKKIIDSLIPNLLNDKNEEPRTFNELNVRAFFSVLLNSKKEILCRYLEDKFFSYYTNDEFALECGMISVVRDARNILHSPLDSTLSYLMMEFTYMFNGTESRLAFIRQLDLEKEDSDND